MDTRKIDMIFFLAYENNEILTYEEMEERAKQYNAKQLWNLWQHTKRYNKYVK